MAIFHSDTTQDNVQDAIDTLRDNLKAELEAAKKLKAELTAAGFKEDIKLSIAKIDNDVKEKQKAAEYLQTKADNIKDEIAAKKDEIAAAARDENDDKENALKAELKNLQASAIQLPRDLQVAKAAAQEAENQRDGKVAIAENPANRTPSTSNATKGADARIVTAQARLNALKDEEQEAVKLAKEADTAKEGSKKIHKGAEKLLEDYAGALKPDEVAITNADISVVKSNRKLADALKKAGIDPKTIPQLAANDISYNGGAASGTGVGAVSGTVQRTV